MAKVCAISGRKAQAGRWTRHPHSGAWAHRAPAKGRRFEVNLQTVSVPTPHGKKKIKVAARMLTSRAFQLILSGQKPLPEHLLK
jgi:ribosomal protein L28